MSKDFNKDEVARHEANVSMLKEMYWSQERVQKCFDELGFVFPETEEQLQALNEKFKYYPFKADEKKIDPIKILQSVNMSKELSAKDFFETEKPFLNNFDPVENVSTYGKLDMFEWADRFATARLEAYKAELIGKFREVPNPNEINIKTVERFRRKGYVDATRKLMNHLSPATDESK